MNIERFSPAPEPPSPLASPSERPRAAVRFIRSAIASMSTAEPIALNERVLSSW